MVTKITLTDGVVLLRPFEIRDADELARAVRKSIPDLLPWMSWCHKGYNRSDAARWLKTMPLGWKNGTDFGFAITDEMDGQILGGCGLSSVNQLSRFANLGYWVRSDRSGEGIAGRSALLVARFAFEKVGLVRAEIVVAGGNHKSLRVAEKIGAQREGLLRNRLVVRDKIYNAVMFSLIPHDFGLEIKPDMEKGSGG